MNAVAVLCSGGLDSAVLLAREAREAPVLPVYVRSGLAWEREEQRLLERLLAALPPSPTSSPWPRCWWTCGTSIRPPTGRCAARRPHTTRRTRTSTSRGGTCCCSPRPACSARCAASTASPSARSPATRSRTRRRPSSRRSRAPLSIGLDHEIRVVTPFAHLHKEDVIRLGDRAGRAVRVHALVHEPVGREALRGLQQVPRAARRLRGGRGEGPDGLPRAIAEGIGGRVSTVPSP